MSSSVSTTILSFWSALAADRGGGASDFSFSSSLSPLSMHSNKQHQAEQKQQRADAGQPFKVDGTVLCKIRIPQFCIHSQHRHHLAIGVAQRQIGDDIAVVQKYPAHTFPFAVLQTAPAKWRYSGGYNARRYILLQWRGNPHRLQILLHNPHLPDMRFFLPSPDTGCTPGRRKGSAWHGKEKPHRF